MTEDVLISKTAFQNGFGARYRTASGLTKEERLALRTGIPVLFKGDVWSRKGQKGTRWREVYFKKFKKYNHYFIRVPSEELLEKIGEQMVYGKRSRLIKKEAEVL